MQACVWDKINGYKVKKQRDSEISSYPICEINIVLISRIALVHLRSKL